VVPVGMKKREIFMLSTLSFSLGMILGFLISPIKEGVYNIAGNSTSNNYDKRKLTEDDDEKD
jgi:hypothetical protein